MKKSKVDFRFLVITNSKSLKTNVMTTVSLCSKYGVKAIQLREKDLSSVEFLALGRRLRKNIKRKLIINDRLDIALLSKANGVHSPEKGINAVYIKEYGKNFIAGRSVHSVKQATSAEKEGFDYLLFGPIFRTPQKIKYGYSPQGLKMLEDVCNSVKIPVFAVGGITSQRVKKCLNAGAHGVAVIRAIMKSNNIKKTVREFKTELGEL